MSTHQSSHRAAWSMLLLSISLVLGLTFCFIISPRLVGSGVTVLDPDGYGSTGRVLYETGRFDSIEKAPLYPAFITLVSFMTGGYHVWAVQTAQCLLAALTCVVVYAIFRRTMGEDPARWAGLACALCPMLIWYTPRLWTETLLTFILAGFTLVLVELLQRPTDGKALLCGVAGGILALSKGIALIFVLLTPLVLFLRLRSRAFRWITLFGLSMTALIAPWTWRNWRLTGELLPIHANGGYNFYLGNGFARHWSQAPLSYVELKAYAVQDIETLYATLPQGPPEDPIRVDRVLLRAALDEMKARPLFILRKLTVQCLTFWYLAADVSKSLLTGVLQFPIVLVALAGVARGLRRRAEALTLLVPVVGMMGVSVAVFAFGRLSATIMPYLIGLAVYGLWPERRQSRSDEALS